jgi:parvulin-like peptidyl-prolyl isomerase
MRQLALVTIVSLLAVACQKLDKPKVGLDLDSKDILARTKTTPEVLVKHVLVGWKELEPAYRGHMDPRAGKRTQAEAAALAQDIATKLRANPGSIDELVKASSEDPGSLSGDPYTIKQNGGMVPEFEKLALRLELNEVGVVKTMFGYHVMIRVAPAPPDPLESADILARPAKPGTVLVQHVLVGWKNGKRTKQEADKLAKDIADKARAGADMGQLMKDFSEDPGSKDNARAYEVSAGSGMVEPFEKLSLRLEVGEVGIVQTQFGWHVIKRVPPPPPDSLESADILARQPVTQKAKVKHILLGWTAAHTDDPRGIKRDRATLEKLVKDTVDKLAKGAKIEPLMAELSEDPGSAKAGTSYDATPDAGLVPPFKNLSLRLNVKEVGVVKTDFGIHIIQRVE